MSAPQPQPAGDGASEEKPKDVPAAAHIAETDAKSEPKAESEAKGNKANDSAKAKEASDKETIQTQSKQTAECADCKQRAPAKLTGKFVAAFNRRYTLYPNEQFPGFNTMGLQRFRSFTNKVCVLCVFCCDSPFAEQSSTRPSTFCGGC